MIILGLFWEYENHMINEILILGCDFYVNFSFSTKKETTWFALAKPRFSIIDFILL